MEDAKEDGWGDEELKRVICQTDKYMEEEFEDEIRLIEAQSFIESIKKRREKTGSNEEARIRGRCR